jgi:hypothetical protein
MAGPNSIIGAAARHIRRVLGSREWCEIVRSICDWRGLAGNKPSLSATVRASALRRRQGCRNAQGGPLHRAFLFRLEPFERRGVAIALGDGHFGVAHP